MTAYSHTPNYPLRTLSQRPNSATMPQLEPEETPLSSRTTLTSSWGRSKKKRISDATEEETLLGANGDDMFEQELGTEIRHSGRSKGRTIPLQPACESRINRLSLLLTSISFQISISCKRCPKSKVFYPLLSSSRILRAIQILL